MCHVLCVVVGFYSRPWRSCVSCSVGGCGSLQQTLEELCVMFCVWLWVSTADPGGVVCHVLWVVVGLYSGPWRSCVSCSVCGCGSLQRTLEELCVMFCVWLWVSTADPGGVVCHVLCVVVGLYSRPWRSCVSCSVCGCGSLQQTLEELCVMFCVWLWVSTADPGGVVCHVLCVVVGLYSRPWRSCVSCSVCGCGSLQRTLEELCVMFCVWLWVSPADPGGVVCHVLCVVVGLYSGPWRSCVSCSVCGCRSLQRTLEELRHYQRKHKYWQQQQEKLITEQAPSEVKLQQLLAYESHKSRQKRAGHSESQHIHTCMHIWMRACGHKQTHTHKPTEGIQSQ